VEKLLFGTAGIPLSTPSPADTINGISQVRSLSLSAMELEFVQNVNISREKAPLVKETAKKNGITLTAHGSYYVNLNSDERPKYHASVSRILQAAKILHACGGYSLVFHAGFYLGKTPSQTYGQVKEALKELTASLKDESISLWLRPETTGKPSQFGSLEEIVKLSEEVENILPCIDFSHLYARSAGKFNSNEDFASVLSQIEKSLGKEALKNMHVHLSGMNYTEKGERNHLNFSECKINYKGVLEALHEFKCAGVVISESPNIEGDALISKRYFEGLR